MNSRRRPERSSFRSLVADIDGLGHRQAMSALEGNDGVEATRDKRDAQSDVGLAACSTGSVSMPTNCVVCRVVCSSTIFTR